MGASHLRFVLADGCPAIVQESQELVNSQAGSRGVIAQVRDGIRRLVPQGAKLIGIAIGVPGGVDPKTGVVMEVSTTQPGMQIYSDNVTRAVPGKGRKPYGNHYSMSFETQHYPDSPNRPEFPSTVVTPSMPLHEVTVYKFSIGK